MNTPVIGTTRDRAEAEALVGRLIRSGFSDADISVLFPIARTRREGSLVWASRRTMPGGTKRSSDRADLSCPSV
jgi:hypothetical protein